MLFTAYNKLVLVHFLSLLYPDKHSELSCYDQLLVQSYIILTVACTVPYIAYKLVASKPFVTGTGLVH